ncbi:MAG TPA: PQQ-dependent sugar dehydrogenase [Tepidisphaeraceae bacterium]|jgi:glucose/arabinose dehydrogenase
MKILLALVSSLAAATSLLAATINDPNLKIQSWTTGLDTPTSLAFVDGGATTLVLEKNTGRVQVVKNRKVVGTALDLPVANESERGLLGIAVAPDFATSKAVYLYFTRSATSADGSEASDNRVERFTWNGSKLVYSKRIIKLPAAPGPNHDGGKIAFGPDNKLYIQIGDLNRNERTQNYNNSKTVSRTGAILRLNPSGSSVKANPFYAVANIDSASAALNDIYAYGIRNGFGLAFDPVSKELWDTENGPERMDEINRVRPGFNSGWERIMGPTSRNGNTTGNLVTLGPRAFYSDPQFSWATPVAPTDLEFISSKLGDQYANDLFVSTLHGGAILDFDLSRTRKSLMLPGPLADYVADNSTSSRLAEQQSLILASGFGTITDLANGPGGLYVLSATDGAIYRIVRNNSSTQSRIRANSLVIALPEPTCAATLLLFTAVFIRRRNAQS